MKAVRSEVRSAILATTIVVLFAISLLAGLPGVRGAPTLTITSAPLLTSMVGIEYHYQVNTSESGASFVLAGNATWLSTNATGYLNGTPVSRGYYIVNITATKGADTAYEQYTLFSYASLTPVSNAYSPAAMNPNVVVVGNRIYVAYMTGVGPGPWSSLPTVDSWPGISAITYDGQRWGSSTVVDTNPPDVWGNRYDTHGTPAMVRNSTGYLFIFFGCHDTLLLYRVSTHPDNTSSWGPQQNVSLALWKDHQDVAGYISASYPFPFIVPGSQRMYVAFRLSEYDIFPHAWAYMYSDDNGTTWEPSLAELQLVDPDYVAEGADAVAIYLTFAQPRYVAGDFVVPFTWNLHNYSLGKRSNIYYALWDLTTGHLYNASGVDLGVSIVGSPEFAQCIVYTNKPVSAALSMPELRPDGHPVILSTEQRVGYDYPYVEDYFEWNGTAWSAPQVILNATVYLNGVQVFMKSGGDMDVYFDNMTGAAPTLHNQISLWHYTNATQTWVKEYVIIGPQQSVRPLDVWGTPMKVIGGEDREMIYMAASPLNEAMTSNRTGFAIFGNTTSGLSRFYTNATPSWTSWAPTITSTPPSSVGPGSVFTYQMKINETTGGEAVYSLSSSAHWLSIDARTGLIASTAPVSPGSCGVIISVRSVFGLGTASQYFTITIPGGSNAGISCSFSYWGEHGFMIHFTDHTTGAPILEWSWTFGDGTTSSLQNPSHTYAKAGDYIVTLEVRTTYQQMNYVTTIHVPVTEPKEKPMIWGPQWVSPISAGQAIIIIGSVSGAGVCAIGVLARRPGPVVGGAFIIMLSFVVSTILGSGWL